MKTIISCHYCASVGIKQNLAEILPNGMIKVQRFESFTGNREFTVIRSNEYEIICGNCGNVVYKKEENDRKEAKNEINDIGQQGLYRFTLIETTIRLGTPSYTNYSGSVI